MTNESAGIKIRGRLVNFPDIDGLTEIEKGTIIRQVEEKINRIQKDSEIADTGKLAMLAAYEFNVELYNIKQKDETDNKANERKVDALISSLEKVLDAK